MTWWKGEDSWDEAADFIEMTADAGMLFLRSQSRMARLGTDGAMTVRDFEVLDLARPKLERERRPWREVLAELVRRGLYIDDGEGGWRDPRWLARNPSKAEIDLQRRWDVLRQQLRFARDDNTRVALREKEEAVKRELWEARSARKSAGHSLVNSHGDSQVNSQRPGPSRPDKTRTRPPRSVRRSQALTSRGQCAECGRPSESLRKALHGLLVCPECARGGMP